MPQQEPGRLVRVRVSLQSLEHVERPAGDEHALPVRRLELEQIEHAVRRGPERQRRANDPAVYPAAVAARRGDATVRRCETGHPVS